MRRFFITLTVCLALSALIVPAQVQQKSKDEPQIVAPTPEQQIPLLGLLRERALIDARIEGGLVVMRAFLGLSPDCVARMDETKGIYFECPAKKKAKD